MNRTSVTHPLRIDTVTAGPGYGRIGITFCPGKYDPHGHTASWDRDLALDLNAIQKWGASAVVTLLEDQELKLLSVQHLGDEVRRRGMSWFHLPIVDVSTPDKDFERAWESAGGKLRSMLKNGADIVVHCRGGLGRAGTIAARLLVELGREPKETIAKVRSARPGAIETLDQEKFVLKLRPKVANPPPKVSTLRSKSAHPQERARDWFKRLTGFQETSYGGTRAKLAVDGDRLRSLVNGESYGIGELELVSLHALRDRVKSSVGLTGRLKVGIVTGDVRQMHQAPQNVGALFQVASQFNLLEMISPSVTPEDGVTRYQHDPTQGPACAIAAGAATVYRNYFAPVGGGFGQTKDRQLDALSELGETLSKRVNRPVSALWEMRNGYALCSSEGLDMISAHLETLGPEEKNILRGKLSIGIHRDVEVSEASGDRRPSVSQAFCSALPVSYTNVPPKHWEKFATLVLEAAYEATMFAAIMNARRGASNIVLLTQLGGGAFGNRDDWIHGAMRRALKLASGSDLDVKLVSYGSPSRTILQIAQQFGHSSAE
jgi:protein-tyrosine phosphatase